MRLFEAIVDANHRAVAGDATAGLRPDDFREALPIVALTCIDPRLNAYFPNALALPAEDFIWLRNAGNIITSPLSSTMRSLALACAVKGGREIAIIGHTDCQVARTTAMTLLEKLTALGVDRSRLPDNLNEFFGVFSSERQNIIKACDFTRHSPLIGPKIPVHGLLIDINTGKLDWLVNGYETLAAVSAPIQISGHAPSGMGALGGANSFEDFAMGEMKFPDMKIGDASLSAKSHSFDPQAPQPPPAPSLAMAPPPAVPPPLPRATIPPRKITPPPIRPHPNFQRT